MNEISTNETKEVTTVFTLVVKSSNEFGFSETIIGSLPVGFDAMQVRDAILALKSILTKQQCEEVGL